MNASSPPAFVLGVDLDGVCADFYGGLKPIAAEWLDVPVESLGDDVSFGLEEWGVPDAPGGYTDLHRFAVTQRGLFKALAPMPRCSLTLRKISKLEVRIRIITHRLFIHYFHRQSILQTVDWLEHHAIPYWDLCFMRDKDEVGANLYVEDAPSNVEALRGAGCDVVVFGNSTNRHCADPRVESWDEVYDIVRERLEAWRAGGSSTESRS